VVDERILRRHRTSDLTLLDRSFCVYGKGEMLGAETETEAERSDKKVIKKFLSVSLSKPLGLTLQENDLFGFGAGAHIAALLPDGNAAKFGMRLESGMILLEINEVDVREMDFEDIMDLLIDAPSDREIQLCFSEPLIDVSLLLEDEDQDEEDEGGEVKKNKNDQDPTETSPDLGLQTEQSNGVDSNELDPIQEPSRWVDVHSDDSDEGDVGAGHFGCSSDRVSGDDFSKKIDALEAIVSSLESNLSLPTDTGSETERSPDLMRTVATSDAEEKLTSMERALEKMEQTLLGSSPPPHQATVPPPPPPPPPAPPSHSKTREPPPAPSVNSSRIESTSSPEGVPPPPPPPMSSKPPQPPPPKNTVPPPPLKTQVPPPPPVASRANQPLTAENSSLPLPPSKLAPPEPIKQVATTAPEKPTNLSSPPPSPSAVLAKPSIPPPPPSNKIPPADPSPTPSPPRSTSTGGSLPSSERSTIRTKRPPVPKPPPSLPPPPMLPATEPIVVPRSPPPTSPSSTSIGKPLSDESEEQRAPTPPPRPSPSSSTSRSLTTKSSPGQSTGRADETEIEAEADEQNDVDEDALEKLTSSPYSFCSICRHSYTPPSSSTSTLISTSHPSSLHSNQTQRLPHMLKCFHTFCSSCLNDLLKHTGISISCPTCLSRTTLGPNGIRSLPLSFLHMKAIPVLCGNCDEAIAKYQCLQCSADCQMLCGECSRVHKQMKAFKTHQLRPIYGVKKSSSSSPLTEPKLTPSNQFRICPKHYTNNKFQDMYCVSCEVMLCRICSVFDHPNHHLVTLPEGRRLFEQQDMRRRQDHLSDLLIRDKELLAETQQSLLQMDSEKCVIVQEMERLCERLSEDITERMREVAEEIEGMSVDKGRRVREQTEQIGRHLKEREEMLERIEEIIRGGDHQVSGSGSDLSYSVYTFILTLFV
jgi:hypothetical protein